MNHFHGGEVGTYHFFLELTVSIIEKGRTKTAVSGYEEGEK
jgi:hypothetical protein